MEPRTISEWRDFSKGLLGALAESVGVIESLQEAALGDPSGMGKAANGIDRLNSALRRLDVDRSITHGIARRQTQL